MAVTLADLKARYPDTDLGDDELQRILDAQIQSVDRSAGKASSETQNSRALGAGTISLLRPATAVTEVLERRSRSSDEETLTDGDDYRLFGKYEVVRMGTCWGSEVTITYTPEVDQELRDEVTLELCHMDIEFKAQEETGAGDYDEMQKDHAKRRRQLLARIREGRSPVH